MTTPLQCDCAPCFPLMKCCLPADNVVSSAATSLDVLSSAALCAVVSIRSSHCCCLHPFSPAVAFSPPAVHPNPQPPVCDQEHHPGAATNICSTCAAYGTAGLCTSLAALRLPLLSTWQSVLAVAVLGKSSGWGSAAAVTGLCSNWNHGLF